MKNKYFHINKNGSSIHCKIYFNDLHAVKRVVICLHGFTGNMENKAVERFADYVLKKNKDAAVMIYNAPCHGDDVKKKLSLVDCDAYITLVTEYAKSRFNTDELYVYANSFGGYQFLKYISEHGNPYRKLALRCPAVNMLDTMMGLASPADRQALEKNKPVTVGFERKIKITRSFVEELEGADISVRDYKPFAGDIVIIHGKKDEVVSFDFVEGFAAENGIRFVPVENANHRFVDPSAMDTAVKTIAEFFGFNT